MHRRIRPRRASPLTPTVISLAALAVALWSWGGCSAGGGADGGGGGAAAASSGTASSGTGGNLFGGGSNTGGSGASGGACAGTSKKAEKLPLDMYIMLDQSGSMTDPVSGGGDKWGAVTSAIQSFVGQPAAAGLGVGIQYFPIDTGVQCPLQCLDNNACGPCGPCFQTVPNFPGFCMNAGSDSCNPADYAQPEVAIAVLPGVAAAIIASMNAHSPGGGTPTSAALQGALDYTAGWAGSHPDHVVIAVLATDGDPTSCDTDLANINAIAAAGANGTPAILTFVIGVGSSLTALNGIAAAGGTGQAFLVDTNQDVTQQFLDALNQIQGTALGCVYDIPQPDEGTPDFDKVNVSYTPDPNSPAEIIPKVGGASDCQPGEDGWYYDNNAAPTKIILCDASCTKIAGDADGQVDIVLGCATVLK